MAVAMKGLRIKPTYEQLIGIAVSDGLEQINSKGGLCNVTVGWRRG